MASGGTLNGHANVTSVVSCFLGIIACWAWAWHSCRTLMHEGQDQSIDCSIAGRSSIVSSHACIPSRHDAHDILATSIQIKLIIILSYVLCHPCMHIYILLNACIYLVLITVYTYVYIYIYIYIYIYMYIYIHIYIRLYIYIYIYIYSL